MKRYNNVEYVGIINVGNFVYVTDPCYKPAESVKLNTVPGEWAVEVNIDDDIVTDLIAFNPDEIGIDPYSGYESASLSGEDETNVTGVDSGQVVIADGHYYDNHFNNGDYDDEQGFYRKICDLTLNQNVGIFDKKVAASSSGNGDGTYPIYTVTNSDNLVVGIHVQFIKNNDYEDEYDED